MNGWWIFVGLVCGAAAAYMVYVVLKDKKDAKVQVAQGLPADGWYRGTYQGDLERQ
jgi:hypothetical protein